MQINNQHTLLNVLEFSDVLEEGFCGFLPHKNLIENFSEQLVAGMFAPI
jgi:hypothetical protein